jgi:hypothetical protein
MVLIRRVGKVKELRPEWHFQLFRIRSSRTANPARSGLPFHERVE